MAKERRKPRREKEEKPWKKQKKKVCIFCKDRVAWVDYKDVNLLRRFMSDRGKIRARRVTGNCAQHQRDVAVAIKTARELVLLPYTQRTTTERAGGRGPRGFAPRERTDGAAAAPDVEIDVGVTEDLDLEGSLDIIVGASCIAIVGRVGEPQTQPIHPRIEEEPINLDADLVDTRVEMQDAPMSARIPWTGRARCIASDWAR